jgi:hypothetical protein
MGNEINATHFDHFNNPSVTPEFSNSLDLQMTPEGTVGAPTCFSLRGRLHSAFSMCVFMSDKLFVAEACPPMSHASASNGLSEA